MKSIIDTFPSNKVRGIYRIFIQAGKHEFCYVSYAENVYGAIKDNRNAILRHFKYSNATKDLLQHYALPEKNKTLFHFSIFLVAKIHGLNETDIKYDLLEKTSKQDELELDLLEQKWIDHYQCEKYGFNSAFKYLEKFVEATMYNMEGKLEHYRTLWAKTQIKLEDFSAHDQRHIDKEKWYRNPTNAFLLLDRGYIQDKNNWFKQEWKKMFDKIKSFLKPL